MALAVGAGAGVGAVVFRYLILWFTQLFSGHADYSASPGVPNPLLGGLGRWFVVLVPVAGGLLYRPLIHRFAREARGHGVPEVMYAVAERGGRFPPPVAAVKSLASALCIGAGGSVGREGPIVQIGSALGSTVGQLARVPQSRLRLLVACGAAGGISATFNAPIAGVFFALELILRDFEAESFGIVVLASVVAGAIGRAAFGQAAFLNLPAFQLASPLEYAAYALLGVLAAVVGVAFVKVLYGVEDLCDRVWHGPEWLRPAVGGLLEDAIRGRYTVAFLLLLLAGKLLATSLTIGIGGSGGVFAPSLSSAPCSAPPTAWPSTTCFPARRGPAGAYGLLGMGAVFAGAARAPITAVLIIFRTDRRVLNHPALMAAIVLTAGVSRLASHDTIYTLELARRGVDLTRSPATRHLEGLTVATPTQPAPS